MELDRPRPTRRLTWRNLLTEAEAALGSANDARRIVERASGHAGPEWWLHLDDLAPERAVPFFASMVERRAAGEPLQYVVGQWGFRRLDLMVDRRVLIPRPETEVVVQMALGELARLVPALRAATPRVPPTVVDLGTGSGAIALSLAVEVPGAEVWATDASHEALAVARANLTGIGTLVARRVRLAEGSWYDALSPMLRGRVHLVVSNPPYVAASDELPPEVADWEPRRALVSGPTGLEAIEAVVAEAPGWLARPGSLVVEIAPHQAEAARALAEEAGFDEAEVRYDLAGRERVLVARVRRPLGDGASGPAAPDVLRRSTP